MIIKPHIKLFNNRELLSQLPFHKGFLEESSITKYTRAFKSYASSFTFQVLDFRD